MYFIYLFGFYKYIVALYLRNKNQTIIYLILHKSYDTSI